ncbi:hypothetical protein RHDC4_00041 [Rhodocyclaceae bacterium]|nr:hypothetical protein RHDC4_00041 [Rhodocyclaceae bacterium]
MPFEIQWEPRGAYKRFHGFVAMDDLIQAAQRVEGDPRFDDIRYVINDFLAIEGHGVTDIQVRMLAAMDSGAAFTNPNIRIAVVTDRDEVRALVGIYTAPPLNAYPTETFSTLAQARDWLSRPGDPLLLRKRRL